MIPPLWPEKVITLPARGPRPTLKGEEQLMLRVMDDIAVPAQPMLGWHYFKRSGMLNQPNGSSNRYMPASTPARTPTSNSAELMAQVKTATPSASVSVTGNALLSSDSTSVGRLQNAAFVKGTAAPAAPARSTRMNVLVLRDGSTCVGGGLHLHNGRVDYSRADGSSGAVALTEVDWIKTLQQNKDNGVPLTLSSGGQ